MIEEMVARCSILRGSFVRSAFLFAISTCFWYMLPSQTLVSSSILATSVSLQVTWFGEAD